MTERLLGAQFIQLEQQDVGRAGSLPLGHQVIPPSRNDVFKGLSGSFVATID
jgi:hypothetical protein